MAAGEQQSCTTMGLVTAASVSLAPTLHTMGNIPGANFLIRTAQHLEEGEWQGLLDPL